MAILNSNEVRRLYDEQAGAYDASLALFRLSGLRRWRASLINALELSPGDTVGRVGNTGLSTGAHLHLAMIDVDGTFFDPLSWLQSHVNVEWGQ